MLAPMAVAAVTKMAWGIVGAKVAYDTSKKVKSTVEKVVDQLQKAVDITGKFLTENGVKVRERYNKAKSSKSGKKVGALFDSARTKAKDITNRALNRVRGDEIAADEMDDLQQDNRTSTVPPPLTTNHGYTEEEIIALAKAQGLEVKATDEDGLEDEDGEPTEKGYLKLLTESIMGEKGVLTKGKGKLKGTWDRWSDNLANRMDARKKEVEEEKAAVQERMKQKNKSGGGALGKLLKALFFPLLLLLKPLKFMAGAIAKATGQVVWWATKKLLGGIAKGVWWLGKNIVKGVFKGSWWLFKKFSGALGKGLKLLGKGIYKMSPQWAKNLFDAVGKWGKNLMGGVKNLGSVFKNSILDLGGKMKGWFSNLGTKLGSLKDTLKPKNLLSKGWNFLKNGFSSGGWARTALRTAGSAIVRVGARVVAGIVAVGPVGWVIGIGLALWGAYELYKYFKDGKGKFPDTPAGNISQLRMYSYGLAGENSNYFKKIFELEEILGRFMSRRDDGTVDFKEPDQQGQKDIADSLGLDSDDPGSREEVTQEWLTKRFVPAYREFLRVLWNQKPDKKAGELDSLTKIELAKLIYDYDPPGEIWDYEQLPFTDYPKSTMTRNEFEEMHLSIKRDLENEWAGIQTKQANDKRQEVQAKNSGTMHVGGAAAAVAKSWESNYDKNGSKDSKSELNEHAKATANMLGLEGYTGATGENVPIRNYHSSYSGMAAGAGDYQKATAYNGIKTYSSDNPLSKIFGSDTLSEYGYYKNGPKADISPVIYGSSVPAYTGPNRSYTLSGGDGSMINPEEMGSMSLDQVFSRAAAMTGMPEEILWTFAKLETGLNPLAKAKGSSASGLFQMINATWKTMVERYGKKYGITPDNANRWNPLQNTLMGAEYMKENVKNIKGYRELGLDLGTALYFAHFFGGGGVKKFFAKMKQNPDMPMKFAVSDSVYRANLAAMGGLTIRQFVDKYRARFNTAMETPAEKYKGYRDHRAQYPDLYKDSKPNDKPKEGSLEIGEGEGGSVAAEMGMEPTGDGGGAIGVGGVAGALSGAFDMSTDFVKNGGSGNVGIDLMNKMGLVSKDSKYYTGSDGTYSGNDGYGGGSGGYGDVSMAGSGDYTGEKEILGFDYATSDSESVKVHPIKAGYPFYFTSLYGPRNTGIPGASTTHGGVDIGTPTRQAGVPIVATGAGKVWRAYRSKSYGLVVYLIHPDGNQTRYAHLSKILVKEGQEVDEGTLVGLMGNTGVGSGVHLHFEVRKGHKQDSPTIDPFAFAVIKNSYKGPKVPTVIEENGKIDSDEDLTEEKQEEKTLSALGVMGPVGLAALEMQKDPVTGEMPTKPEDNKFDGLFVDPNSSSLTLTTQDTGVPVNPDELYETQYKDKMDRKTFDRQLGMQAAFAKHNASPEMQERKALADEIRQRAEEKNEVKVDVDVNTKTLEESMRENSEAIKEMSEFMRLLVEHNINLSQGNVDPEKAKEFNKKSSALFGGRSIRSTQGVSFDK